MRKSKHMIVSSLLCLLLCLTGCGYSAYETHYSDIKDYSEIWELTGFCFGLEGYADNATVFPESVKGLTIKDFHCRYDEQLPLGEGIQVYLESEYQDSFDFETEVERVSNIGFQCDEYFYDSGYQAYATHLGDRNVSDYALIDAEQKIIYYIYVQSLPIEEIEFNHDFLPEGYGEYGEIE